MKHSLSKTGLSLSQAQSVSNLLYQNAEEIATQIEQLNNCSKTVTIDGKEYIAQKGHQIPDNICELIIQKGKLHSAQAFLMENIKMKDVLLNAERHKPFDYGVQEPTVVIVPYPTLLQKVDEDWGKQQLTISEYNEYLEAESMAAHIGQFIHKKGKLDNLRKELSSIPTFELMELEVGKQTPISVDVHHTTEQLLSIHTELAAKHREYEQCVNYFKAKIKNLVTEENARIQKENASILSEYKNLEETKLAEYQKQMQEYLSNRNIAEAEFEEQRQNNILEISKMRIQVDPRYKETIDEYLKKLGKE